MPTQPRSTTVRGIDYASTFRFTDIFRSFRIAVQPGKLMLGLLLVVAMFVASLVLDGLFGGSSVLPGEFDAFITAESVEAFDAWRDDQREQITETLTALLRRAGVEDAERVAAGDHRFADTRAAIDGHYRSKLAAADPGSPEHTALKADWHGALGRLDDLRPIGVFRTALNEKITSFGLMIDALAGLRFGWAQFNPAEPIDRHTVFGSVRAVLFELPAWLWRGHASFMVVWLVVFGVIWSLFGGAISRMAVVESATDDRVGAFVAMTFARRRWGQYILAPVLPPIIVGLFTLVLALVGLLYHVPALDIVAGVLFAVAIPIGFVMAFFIVGWLGAVHLMYPAISAEGTDAFDALSRSYSYVINRPWRFVAYTAIALVYGAVTYLFVGLFVFLALALAQGATALWAGGFDAIFPPPNLGQLRYSPDVAALNGTERVAATLISIWVHLTIGLVAAYAISYYFSCFSTIYLLLRRSCDGVSTTEYFDDRPPFAPPTDEKVEPAPATDVNEPAPLTQADSE